MWVFKVNVENRGWKEQTSWINKQAKWIETSPLKYILIIKGLKYSKDTENSIVTSHASIPRFDTCQQFSIFFKKQRFTGRVEALISLSILLFFPRSNNPILKLVCIFVQLSLVRNNCFLDFKFHINYHTVHILQLAFICSISFTVNIFYI